jgi:hypothetical protein
MFQAGWLKTSFDHVDRLEAESAEHLRKRRAKTLCITLSVCGWESSAAIAAVETLRGGLNIAPLPSNRPFVVKVVISGVDKDHVVDGGSTTQNASSSGGRIVADVLGPEVRVANVRRKTRNIDLSELVVPEERCICASSDSRSLTSLEEEDRVIRCTQSFSSDDTGWSTSNDDVVILNSGSNAGDAEPSCNGLGSHIQKKFRSEEVDC